MAANETTKYREIYLHLERSILTGELLVGHRLPTEVELARRFSTSRVTVARAIRDLVREGLVIRRKGSGSFVCQKPAATKAQFGMVAATGAYPGVFGMIADEVMRCTRKQGFGLLADRLTPRDFQSITHAVEEFCQHLFARKIKGLFYLPLAAPLDLMSPSEQVAANERIVGLLNAAGIPVILIDRDLYPHPRRSSHDLVGMDNIHAGYTLTRHLLALGYRRIDFVSWAWHSHLSTSGARLVGYREALREQGITPDPHRVHDEINDTNIDDPAYLRELVGTRQTQAFVCNNDHLAASLMRGLTRAGFRVPQDVALVGVDDDQWGRLLGVALTTFRQPGAQIGAVATRMMFERLADPTLTPRNVCLMGELIVRESCGVAQRKGSPNGPNGSTRSEVPS